MLAIEKRWEMKGGGVAGGGTGIGPFGTASRQLQHAHDKKSEEGLRARSRARPLHRTKTKAFRRTNPVGELVVPKSVGTRLKVENAVRYV